MPEPASDARRPSSENTGTESGSSGAPTMHSTPSRLSRFRYAAMSCGAEIVSRMKSKVPACSRHLLRIGRDHDFVGAELLRIGDLVRRRGELHDVRAERVAELESHVSEPAESHHAELLALADVPVLERRVRGDAGAEQGSGGREIELVRDVEHEASSTTIDVE